MVAVLRRSSLLLLALAAVEGAMLASVARGRAVGVARSAAACTPCQALARRATTPAMGLVRKVDTAQFEEEIQDCATPILVDIFATWCGPCQLMAPQLEKMSLHVDDLIWRGRMDQYAQAITFCCVQAAETLGDRCRVLKIDADEEPEVASALAIQGLPTVLLINDMKVVMRAEGALMSDEILQLAEHHFFNGPPPEIEGLRKAN